LEQLELGPPKPEACWSGRNKELYVAFILTVSAQHDEDSEPGSFDLELSALAIELSRYSDLLFTSRQ